MKPFFHVIIISALALGSAATVAYVTAHLTHTVLGFPRSVLREQALMSAALMAGLLAVEMLTSKER